MQVYIFRHAKANFSSADRDPPISPEGTADAKRIMALASGGLGFHPTAIVSSPVLRAKQTAELAKKELKVKSMEVDDCLYGDASPADVIKFLSKYKDRDRVALVSHMPLIFELLYALIGGRGEVELLNGSIAAVGFKGKAVKGKGKLLWLAQPGA